LSDGGDRAGGRDDDGPGMGRWLTIGGWLLAALLGGYVVVSQARRGEGDRAGLLSERNLTRIAFWLPLSVLFGACALGALWSMQVYRRREKASVLWTRNAFVFGIFVSMLLVFGVMDEGSFPRQWLAPWCTALVAAQASLFAYASFREKRRTLGHPGDSRRSRTERTGGGQ
jgi:hypothetical protein